MTTLLGILLYFGALIIPVVYLISTRWRGAARRQMLVGIGLQVFWSLAVWAFVYFSWRAGYQDAWMGWSLLLPVNAIGFLYFIGVLIFYGRQVRGQR
jgi:hypothetical protein